MIPGRGVIAKVNNKKIAYPTYFWYNKEKERDYGSY